ncbi:MAG: hypothetical protein KJ902_02045, partial [Candidatus Omnitrophica bacterium]|nr:hypothetical protein [Candidatus Omnitrophota bacterium]
ETILSHSRRYPEVADAFAQGLANLTIEDGNLATRAASMLLNMARYTEEEDYIARAAIGQLLRVESLEPAEIEADKFAQWQKWVSLPISMDDLNVDMFRDYDYRSTGPVLKPEMVFRFGLAWSGMALEKARAAGIENRKVLISRDARKIEPELVEALAAAFRYMGLDVIYVAATGPNACTSYSWATQEHKPLMSIFITASHVSRPPDVIVRGFKVAMLDRKGGNLQSMTTKEIKQTSKAAVIDIIKHPDRIQGMEAVQKGRFIPSNIDENSVRMCSLIGEVVTIGVSLYELAREVEVSDSPVDVLTTWERRIGRSEPFKGMKIVVDGSYTPSGRLAADTFERLGAEVVLINGDIQEIEGEHGADPSRERNLAELKRTIEEENADFGIAFDLDGDRGAIVVPERHPKLKTKFHTLPPDNLIVALLPYIIEKCGYDPQIIGKRVGVIQDVLGTFGVSDMAGNLGLERFQTDAGYVFLKARRQGLLNEGYVIPIYGERSGHCWLDVTGEFENPIAVAVLFAAMVRDAKYEDGKSDSLNPFIEAFHEQTIPYAQSTRFQPLFHATFLSELSSDPRNDTGWAYDPVFFSVPPSLQLQVIADLGYDPSRPPQAIIALGKDAGIRRLNREFTIGKSYDTPAGRLTVREFNTYQDSPDLGGLYRFADIVFELDGRFAGRFVFRASSNDPTFVCSFETPVWDGEDYESQTVQDRYFSVGGVVLDWLEENEIAGVTGDLDYPNKEDTEKVVIEYRRQLDAGLMGILEAAVDEAIKQGNMEYAYGLTEGIVMREAMTGEQLKQVEIQRNKVMEKIVVRLASTIEDISSFHEWAASKIDEGHAVVVIAMTEEEYTAIKDIIGINIKVPRQEWIERYDFNENQILDLKAQQLQNLVTELGAIYEQGLTLDMLERRTNDRETTRAIAEGV